MDPAKLSEYKRLQTYVEGLYDRSGEEPKLRLPLYPQQGSSLRADDDKIPGGRTASQMALSLIAGGAANAQALQRLIVSGVVDNWSLWSIARTALESSAQAVWLLRGNRDERVLRAARAWADDLDKRHKWESKSGWRVPEGGESGRQRRDKFLNDAAHKGMDPNKVGGRPKYTEALEEAAKRCGQDPDRVVAAWQLASGFAHGKQWPYLRGSDVTGTDRTREGTVHHVEFSEESFDPLASYIREFLECAVTTYEKRSASTRVGQDQ
ncbi:hypothetical protein O4J56_04500 [Nocardiopsis sp. RSe5-2]|uniref:Uncharacterized protein n=1 Tax=Nocardiopsis endophytica TaxID=3018445 RepID=A0ABT4TYW6_9ACTN|nr:hypothetical protein [Nocardiopsis endophytica]MDA2809889.1 hypothetical protein [Nocardiopsis endophytica]